MLRTTLAIAAALLLAGCDNTDAPVVGNAGSSKTVYCTDTITTNCVQDNR